MSNYLGQFRKVSRFLLCNQKFEWSFRFEDIELNGFLGLSATGHVIVVGHAEGMNRASNGRYCTRSDFRPHFDATVFDIKVEGVDRVVVKLRTEDERMARQQILGQFMEHEDGMNDLILDAAFGGRD